MGRTVITGGAGFVGSHLTERIRRDGHDVLVLDNLCTGNVANLALLHDDPGFEFREVDVSDPFDVDGPVDAIYHMASPASPRDFSRIPVEIMKVGSFGTFNVMELAARKGCPVLVASTSEVYGDPEIAIQDESYWGRVNPIGPRSCYDEAKRFMEAMAKVYQRFRSVEIRIVRIFNTYGPRMGLDDGRALPNFLTQALAGAPLTVYGDGSQTRSFCYVDDLVDGLVRLMASGHGDPVNIGNPHEMTITEFAQTIMSATGSKSTITHLPAVENDPQQRRPDITKARTLLGWEPKVTLAQGLERTILDFRERLAARAAS